MAIKRVPFHHKLNMMVQYDREALFDSWEFFPEKLQAVVIRKIKESMKHRYNYITFNRFRYISPRESER